ncbi:MAG: response regulator [Alphaproteobacteria bacterium]|nr:response regulator [Alphaproteobacteria bacterium]
MTREQPNQTYEAHSVRLSEALRRDPTSPGAFSAVLAAASAVLDADVAELWLCGADGELSRVASFTRHYDEDQDDAREDRRARWLAGRSGRRPASDPVERVRTLADGRLDIETTGPGLTHVMARTIGPPQKAHGVLAFFGDATFTTDEHVQADVIAETLHWRLAAAEQDGGGDLLVRIDRAERDLGRLRTLTRELIEVEERMRARFARLLHDDLQQILVAASFALGSEHDDEDPRMARARHLVKQSINRSRELAVELSPPILEDGTLEDALRWLVRRKTRLYGLQIDLDIDLDAEVDASEVRSTVFRLVQESLMNVRKHARTDRAQVSVGRDERGRLTVVVADQGQGFDPDRSGKGFGTRTLRQRFANLGGELVLDGRPGEGTTVRGILPASVFSEAPSALHPALVDGVATPGSLRCVVVDDHELVRSGLQDAIHAHDDIEVVGTAGTGEEALATVQALLPDVVLLDVNLPDLSGIEVARRLRARHPGLRIVGLSMHDDPEIRASMLRAGANDYVTKGASIARIVASLR